MLGPRALPQPIQQTGCSSAVHLGRRVLWGWATTHNGQDVAPEQHLHDADASIVEASTELQQCREDALTGQH